MSVGSCETRVPRIVLQQEGARAFSELSAIRLCCTDIVTWFSVTSEDPVRPGGDRAAPVAATSAGPRRVDRQRAQERRRAWQMAAVRSCYGNQRGEAGGQQRPQNSAARQDENPTDTNTNAVSFLAVCREKRRRPNIPLAFVNLTNSSSPKPGRSVPGSSYLQALDPPFVPLASPGQCSRRRFQAHITARLRDHCTAPALGSWLS
jgi:hypothetical protein